MFEYPFWGFFFSFVFLLRVFFRDLFNGVINHWYNIVTVPFGCRNPNFAIIPVRFCRSQSRRKEHLKRTSSVKLSTFKIFTLQKIGSHCSSNVLMTLKQHKKNLKRYLCFKLTELIILYLDVRLRCFHILFWNLSTSFVKSSLQWCCSSFWFLLLSVGCLLVSLGCMFGCRFNVSSTNLLSFEYCLV